MIDRPSRPRFPQGFRDEVQIQAMVLSADQENDPDVLAMVGASACLTMSSIPFEGPTGAVRIGGKGQVWSGLPVGNCARATSASGDHLPGCPPSTAEIREALLRGEM